MEEDDYLKRVEATAAKRLAYMLYELGIIGGPYLADFLYPTMEAISKAEKEQIP